MSFNDTDFTLYKYTFFQSLNTLWKGIGSSLMVKGMAVVSESVISEVTPLPK